MSPVQVEWGTRASRAFGMAAIIVVAALVTLPWWGGPGDLRLAAEMAYYLALAMLWNLLAGYAGLVSVGQQAFVGIGAYAFFFLTDSLAWHVYPAMALAGPIAGLISIPVAFAVFRLRGHYFAIGTWVGGRKLRARRQPDRTARCRLGHVAHPGDRASGLGHPFGPGEHRILDVPRRLPHRPGRRVHNLALAPRPRLDRDPGFRAGIGKPRHQCLPHQAVHLRRHRHLHGAGRRADLPAEAAPVA